jgi:hypothetical protein
MGLENGKSKGVKKRLFFKKRTFKELKNKSI